MISSIVKKNKDVTLVHLGLFLHCQSCKFFRCQRLERPGNWPGFCLGDGFNTSHYIDSITFGDLVMLESCHVTSQWHHVSHVATLYIFVCCFNIFQCFPTKNWGEYVEGLQSPLAGTRKIALASISWNLWPKQINLLDPFESFRILSDPFGSFCTVVVCCGWVDTGYIWILLMLTVQTTDPMKWYEMIWNACLMTRGKIVKKIVPKEILYSGGSWVLDVRFLVCLVAMSTVRFSCWSRWPWLGQGSRHLQWQCFQGGTPEGITTTSSWFPPSMWIAGALKPTPTSIPLPTAACSKFWQIETETTISQT